MKLNIRNLEVNYIQYGEGKDVVLLHGWGQNIEMMMPLGNLLQKTHRITILDLPGFGQSDEPKEAWTIYEYEEFIEEVLRELKIENPILIGHSFGGRLSIIYASKNKVDKLILFGSPCIRTKKKESTKVKILKNMKKVPGMSKIGDAMKKYIGSRDYKNASDVMRKILVNTVNEDLSHCAKKILAPTLLIWGDLDEEAPLEDAKKLESIIQDAGLIVMNGCTHYAYLENIHQVKSIFESFIQ